MRSMKMVCIAITVLVTTSGGSRSHAGAVVGGLAQSSLAEAAQRHFKPAKFVWQRRCFKRRKRVCPPCRMPPGSLACRKAPPKRCWYETVRVCRPVRVKIPD
jgi:hypothetical protein